MSYAGSSWNIHGVNGSYVFGTMKLNSWNHFALVRSGDTVTGYMNGVTGSVISLPASQTFQNNSSPFSVGAQSGGSEPAQGYISNVRFIKGTAVYTSAFTPPTAPPTAITNTQLLLSGTNGGIIDQSGRNNLSTIGANVNTTVYKYGTGSISFSGSGQYLQRLTPPVTLYAWNQGSCTIEYWIYANAFTQGGNTGGDPVIIGNMSATTTGNYWSFGPITNGTVKFYYYNGSIQAFATTSTLSTGQWYHLAFVNNSGALAIYINGVSSATSTISGTPVNGSDNPITIGSSNNASFNGYIDDLRITRYARYTANFTPPTSQLLGQ
jgi:hypothetical protein